MLSQSHGAPARRLAPVLRWLLSSSIGEPPEHRGSLTGTVARGARDRRLLGLEPCSSSLVQAGASHRVGRSARVVPPNATRNVRGPCVSPPHGNRLPSRCLSGLRSWPSLPSTVMGASPRRSALDIVLTVPSGAEPWPGPRLITLLACQLVAAVTSPVGVYLCAQCGHVFQPHRRPRSDAPAYCGDEACGRARVRDRVNRSRRAGAEADTAR